MHNSAGIPLESYHFGGVSEVPLQSTPGTMHVPIVLETHSLDHSCCFDCQDEAKNILLGPGYGSYSEDLKQAPFSKSPACQAKVARADDPSFDIEKIANYWAKTVNKILVENGIKEMVAWEDGLRGTAKGEYETESVAVDFWETLFWGAIDGLAEMASKGFDIILANPDYLYFGKFVMNKMMLS